MKEKLLKKLKNLKKKMGFTLIEMVCVIAIIAILIMIIAPNLIGYLDKAKEIKYRALAKNVYTAMVAHDSSYPGQYANGTDVVADMKDPTKELSAYFNQGEIKELQSAVVIRNANGIIERVNIEINDEVIEGAGDETPETPPSTPTACTHSNITKDSIVWKNKDCTQGGTQNWSCDDCSEEGTLTIPANAKHTYKNGVCEDCGYSEDPLVAFMPDGGWKGEFTAIGDSGSEFIAIIESKGGPFGVSIMPQHRNITSIKRAKLPADISDTSKYVCIGTNNDVYVWLDGTTLCYGSNYMKIQLPMYCDSFFSGYNALTSIDLSGFDTGKTESMATMFMGCQSLTSIDISNFDLSSLNDSRRIIDIFQGCDALSTITVNSAQKSIIDANGGRFSGCSATIEVK